MKFHSPPILRVQSCLTDAVVVIFLDYCFTDTHLKLGAGLIMLRNSGYTFYFWFCRITFAKASEASRSTPVSIKEPITLPSTS